MGFTWTMAETEEIFDTVQRVHYTGKAAYKSRSKAV